MTASDNRCCSPSRCRARLYRRALTFSGGVAEYIFGHEADEFGDIAKLLATELTGELSRRCGLPLIDPGQRIRATVIGASQFTVQVSGKTIYLPDPDVLPVHNVPCAFASSSTARSIRTALRTPFAPDLSRLISIATAVSRFAFAWPGDPEHRRLHSGRRGVVRALSPLKERDQPPAADDRRRYRQDLGTPAASRARLAGEIVSIDGMELQELDYVDVGELITPPGVVPVVIKSLLFA